MQFLIMFKNENNTIKKNEIEFVALCNITQLDFG